MAERKALIVKGGWQGHEPDQTTALFEEALGKEGWAVEVATETAVFADVERLKGFDLLVPNWTMGSLAKEEEKGILEAVASGVGFAGAHGGAGDAFRGSLGYQWLVGGIFAGHPYVGPYTVHVTPVESPITAGLPAAFEYDSEQYYMLVDPGVTVLATTPYVHEGATVTMPVIWTKRWGAGRVFYLALGHVAQEYRDRPEILAMTLRGFAWAARG